MHIKYGPVQAVFQLEIVRSTRPTGLSGKPEIELRI